MRRALRAVAAFKKNTVSGKSPLGLLYIGLNDLGNEGFFRWTDATTTNYYNWRPGEPNQAKGSNEDCVNAYMYLKPAGVDEMLNNHWNDNPCSDKLPFVCRKAVPGVLTCNDNTQKCVALLRGTDDDIRNDVSFDTCPDTNLPEVAKSPCRAANQDAHGTPLPSCCTSDFVNQVLENSAVKLALAVITKDQCKEAAFGAASCELCTVMEVEGLCEVLVKLI